MVNPSHLKQTGQEFSGIIYLLWTAAEVLQQEPRQLRRVCCELQLLSSGECLIADHQIANVIDNCFHLQQYYNVGCCLSNSHLHYQLYLMH